MIAGDLVDGIGVYPRQERDLAITDVVEQYVELGRRLAELPERLTIVAAEHFTIAGAAFLEAAECEGTAELRSGRIRSRRLDGSRKLAGRKLQDGRF